MHVGVIRVGVAGWDYRDWEGIVYPSRSPRSFDRLAFLAGFVDVVEINSSFYRPLEPRVAQSWVRRVRGRPDFRLTAKAHRSWTHEPEAGGGAAVSETLRGLAPLRDAGLLGAILVQFPQSFHCTPRAFERLARLLDPLTGWPLVVEVRHASWDQDRAAAWFRERALGWCVVDQPAVGRSTAPARPRATSQLGYVRLHGRNAANWFREDAGRDARYDYLYSAEELEPLAETCRALAREAREVFVIQNNHFRGKALVNALQLKHLLGERRPPAPATLVAEYPDLAGLVGTEPERLF